MSKSDVVNNGAHIGDIAGRDIISINVATNKAHEESTDLLVNSQRAELNMSIQELAATYFKDMEEPTNKNGELRSDKERKDTLAFKSWKRVHAYLGVDVVKQVKRSQFQDAKHFIEQLETEYNHKSIDKKLVAEILTKVKTYKIFNETVDWCFCSFGKKIFKDLNHEQLLQVMEYVNQQIKESKKPQGLLDFIKTLFK